MGYTHYYKNVTLTPEVVKEAKALVKAAPMKLDGRKPNKPLVTAQEIFLNGSEADGEDYETFFIQNGVEGFSFVKTGEQPYDLVVSAILASVMFHGAAALVKSDGNSADSQWVDALDFYKSVTGNDATTAVTAALAQ